MPSWENNLVVQRFHYRWDIYHTFYGGPKFKMCPPRLATISSTYPQCSWCGIGLSRWNAIWTMCAVVLLASNSSLAQEQSETDSGNLQAARPQTDVEETLVGKGFKLSDENRKRQREDVVPFLESYCADCHLDGADEGNVTLDALFNQRQDNDSINLWDRVLGQLRSDLMPPPDMDQPTDTEHRQLDQWVKRAVFRIDAEAPNPGSVVLGRLNRIEYRNTIADLMDYDISTDVLFPPDDTGHGFDNIGEVLTVSPLLMEKYINAATEIVRARVPQVGLIPRVREFAGENYELSGDAKLNKSGNPRFEYHLGGSGKLGFDIDKVGEYRLELELIAAEKFSEGAVDNNVCHVKVTCGKDVLLDDDFERENWKQVTLELERDFKEGAYAVEIDVTPVKVSMQRRELRVQLRKTRIVGPLDDPECFLRPERYTDYFEDILLQTDQAKRASAERVLKRFASRAFRRPVSEATLQRLVRLAESVWGADGGSFELGISQAVVAVLSSPSFIFKETFAEASEERFPLIDEYSLATRMSYFLWSTMPDERLLMLADRGELRKNLKGEIERMITDDRFGAFHKNFVGQWLQTRDVMSVSVDAAAVLLNSDDKEQALRLRDRIDELKAMKSDLTAEQQVDLQRVYLKLRELYKPVKSFELKNPLRRAMRSETEMLFAHLVETDADLIDLIDCDFTFLNERLAKQYGIKGVQGQEMRRFELKPEHHRGSILTHGSLLSVTSNPDRTSPVKRGLFILDNILGMPTGSPPPDIPALEDAGGEDHENLTLRQSLALHREDPKCSSCHNRMDPLGLALENYDALGRYRTSESGDEVDASGTLITGEAFGNIQDLKKVLSENHRDKFYRCLTVKMMTYALGRSVEYHDTEAIDQIVEQLESSGGTARTLINAIVNSPGFQRTDRRVPFTEIHRDQ